MNAAQQVAAASNLLGLLLAFVALFTSAQSSALLHQQRRENGPLPGAGRRIGTLSAGLAAVTLAALASLWPVLRAVIDAFGTQAWQPTFWVFLLVYLLLLPLCVWQVTIAVGAFRLL